MTLALDPLSSCELLRMAGKPSRDGSRTREPVARRVASAILLWRINLLGAMERPALLTKIRLPQRRPDVVRRPRLLDFLHEHGDRRLLIVCAAAGYGKTTLLVDFAHEVDVPVCWYSMDGSDADPTTFFEYLLLALRQRFPGFGGQSEKLLESIGDVRRETSTIVAALSNDIETEIPDYFYLVLDDYHSADDSEAVNSALDLLIQYMPENCHLVVSSRTLPRLTFSRLAAQRQVAGLGNADLRFTAEELNRLLREHYRLAMPVDQIQKMLDASEGWITGILLTTHTLWMGLVESLVKARGAGSPLFDYLANEAYLQQPPEVQRFLLQSSVLGAMTPELCDRLFAAGTAADMLQHLNRINLFITQLEGPGEWYRYHNLFREFLQTKLRTGEPDLFARLHRLAGQMAEAEGEWDSAMGHYQAAGEIEPAADLVERVGEEMMQSGRWSTLYRWLDSLPTEVIDSRAKLSLYRGRTYLWGGELDRAIAYLDRSSARYRLLGNPDGAAGALTLKSVGLRAKGRLSEAMDACREALVLQENLPSRIAAEAYRDIGICLASQGKLAEAAGQLQRALEIYESIEDEAGAATICQAMGVLAVRTGDLARGMAHYQRALSAWQRTGNVASTADVLNCIASVHYETGEYQQAFPLLEKALASARQSGYLRVEAITLATLGDVQRDSGTPQAALESYERALQIAQRVDEVPLAGYLLNALANTHRLLGDYATAERLLRQALQQAEEGQSPLDVATYSVSAGILAEEQGDVGRAEELLRSAIGPLESSGARRDLARAHFHLAKTLFNGGDREGAIAELESCLELCRQLGYDQFMVAEGQRAQGMLSWAVARGFGGRRLELVLERLERIQLPAPARKRPRIRLESFGPSRIEIYSLGEARVLVDSRLVTSSDWAVEKTKELFFFLLQHPHSLRKEQIVDELWPELELGKSNSQFHSTVYRLRRAIFPQCVAYRDGRYQLTLGKIYWYDAEEFVRLLEEADRSGAQASQRIALYERAVSLYRGPFLEEFYSDWVTPHRDELETRFLQAINRLAKLKAQEGSLEQAIELLRSAVATDPYQEEANYGLMHYAALMGDRAAALRHYKSYVELLRDDLSARPSPVFLDLANRIASGRTVPSL